MGPANERRRYNVTSSLIAWAHTQGDRCLPYDNNEHKIWQTSMQMTYYSRKQVLISKNKNQLHYTWNQTDDLSKIFLKYTKCRL